MNLHRLPFLAAAVLLLVPLPERPRFQPKEASQVRRIFESSMQLELESMELTVGGEELPQEVGDDLEVKLDQSDRFVVIDTFVRVADGRPLELVRSFEQLTKTVSESSGYGGEVEESEEEEESRLEGREVRFTWDADEERYKVAWKEGEGPEELLERLEEDLDLRGILPRREVAEGDSWQVELEDFNHVLSPGGDLKLEGDDEDEPDFGTQFEDHLEGEVRATSGGTRTVEGRELLVIALKAEVQTWAEAEDEDEGEPSTLRIEITFELEGELLWDLAAGRAASLDLEGPITSIMKTLASFETHEGSIEVAQVMHFTGTYKTRARFEAVE